MAYVPRLVDPLLERLLSGLPAVLVVGPRASGKTTTARRYAADELRLATLPNSLCHRLLGGSSFIIKRSGIGQAVTQHRDE